MKSLTQDEVIKKFIEIHGDRFDYSKVRYTNMTIKVCIICPIHGEFYQTPGNHLKGKGCKKCANINLSIFKKCNTVEFIEKAVSIYGDRYDYSKVIYVSAKTKVCIICKEHGEFWQTPDNHLSGYSCGLCGDNNSSLKQRSTKEQFINKAIEIHGKKNDYSNVNYINNYTKVSVTCLTDNHGDFLVTPNNHLSGKGCPRCKKSKGELIITEILKKNNIVFEDEYKLPEIVSNYEYDFYLPDYRILIEFHGIQHYKYSPFFHNNEEDNFLKQKERDILKKDHAYRFKYRLLEFNYLQLEKLSKEQFEQLILKSLNLQSNLLRR